MRYPLAGFVACCVLLLAAACAWADDTTPPTITLTSPTDGATCIAPASISLAATASDDVGVTKVEFYHGTTLLATDTAAPYAYTWSGVAAGSYTVSAKAYDAADNTQSAAAAVTVQARLAGVTLAVSGTNPRRLDSNLTLTATPQPGTGPLAPTVYKFVLLSYNAEHNAYDIATTLRDFAADLTYTWTATPAGTCYLQVQAHDVVNGTNGPTRWASQQVTIGTYPLATADSGQTPPNGALTLTVLANDVAAGGTTLTLTGVGTPTMGGTVTTNGTSITYTAPAVRGTDTFTYTVTDSEEQTGTGTVTVLVTDLPTVSLIEPANNATYTSPCAITLTATASDADGTVAKVEFFASRTKVGEATQAPFTCLWTPVPADTYTLTARVTDSAGAVVTSAGRPLTVTAAADTLVLDNTTPAPDVAISAGWSAATGWPYYFGSNYLIDDMANPATKTVAYAPSFPYDGLYNVFIRYPKVGPLYSNQTPVIIDYAINQPGASVTDIIDQRENGGTWIDLGAFHFAAGRTGSVTISSENTYSTAVADAVQFVRIHPPAVSLTSPQPDAVFTDSAIPLVATATDDDGAIAQVEFYAGTTKLATVPGAGPTFSFTWTNPPSGLHTLTAVATDVAGGEATSSAVTVRVNHAPTVQLTFPKPNSAPYLSGVAIPLTATATDSDGDPLTMTFKAGDEVLETLTDTPYEHLWSNPEPGTYNLTAVVTDGYVTVTSSVVQILVSPAVVEPPTAPEVRDFVIEVDETDLDAADGYNTPPARQALQQAATQQYAAWQTRMQAARAWQAAGAYQTQGQTQPANPGPLTVARRQLMNLSVGATDFDGLLPEDGVAFMATPAGQTTPVLLGTATKQRGCYRLAYRMVLPVGDYNVFARVTSNQGVQNDSASVTVHVEGANTTAPLVFITEPGRTMDAPVNTPLTIAAEVWDFWTASEAEPTVQYYLTLGEQQSEPQTMAGADGHYHASWTPDTPGTFQITVTATATDGETTVIGTDSVTVNVGNLKLNGNPRILQPVDGTEYPAGMAVPFLVDIAQVPVNPASVTCKLHHGDEHIDVQLTQTRQNDSTLWSGSWVPSFTHSDPVLPWTVTTCISAPGQNPETVTLDDVKIKIGSPTCEAHFVAPQNWSILYLGQSVTLQAEGWLSTAPVAFTFAVETPGEAGWEEITTGYQQIGNSASVEWTPTVEGEYCLGVGVKDPNHPDAPGTGQSVRVTVIDDVFFSMSLQTPVANSEWCIGMPIPLVAQAYTAWQVPDIANVDFYLDEVDVLPDATHLIATVTAIGDAPTFQTFWHTDGATPGDHVVYAVARAQGGAWLAQTCNTIKLNTYTTASVAMVEPGVNAGLLTNNPVLLSCEAVDRFIADHTVEFVITREGEGQLLPLTAELATNRARYYTKKWTPTVAGTYSIEAKIKHGAEEIATSPAQTVIVNTPPAGPCATLTDPGPSLTWPARRPLTFTVVLSGIDLNDDLSFALKEFGTGVPHTTTAWTRELTSYSATYLPTQSTGQRSFYVEVTDNTTQQTYTTGCTTITFVSPAAPITMLRSPYPADEADDTWYTPVGGTLASLVIPGEYAIDHVEFQSNTTVIASAADGNHCMYAPFLTTELAPGTYPVKTTVYFTDTSEPVYEALPEGAITVVNPAPNISWLSPPQNGAVNAGTPVILQTLATDWNGQVPTVRYTLNGDPNGGLLSAPPYKRIWWPGSTDTGATFTAIATDIENATQSTTSQITINHLAPVVQLLMPANLTVNAPNCLPLVATAYAKNGTINSVSFYNGSTLLGTASTPVKDADDNPTNTWVFLWDVGAIPDNAGRTVSITAKAQVHVPCDDQGNTSDGPTGVSTPVTVTITNPAPVVTILEPSALAPFVTPADVTLVVSAVDDNNALGAATYTLNGGQPQPLTAVGQGQSAFYSVHLDGLHVGTNTVTVTVNDGVAGATAGTATVSILVNSPAPNIRLLEPSRTSTIPVLESLPLVAEVADKTQRTTRVRFEWRLDASHTWAALDATSGLLAGVPNPVTYSATTPCNVTWYARNLGAIQFQAVALAADNTVLNTSAPLDITVILPANRPGSEVEWTTDLEVYNANGPGVAFTRGYGQHLADLGIHSEGFPDGWVHSFDAKIEAPEGTGWQMLKLTTPDRAVYYLPVTVDGNGVPHLGAPAGETYRVDAQPGTTPGQWNWITFTDNNGIVTFELKPDGYRPVKIADSDGKYITLNWQPDLKSVYSSTNQPHMSLAVGAGTITATDETYTENKPAVTLTIAGNGTLTRAEGPYPNRVITYGYTPVAGQAPQLTTIGTPTPISLTRSLVQHRVYEGSKVVEMRTTVNDAEGNELFPVGPITLRQFTEDSVSTIAKDPLTGAVLSTGHTFLDTMGRAVRSAGADGASSSVTYGSAQFPNIPTASIDVEGRTTAYTLDASANVTQTVSPRGDRSHSVFDGVGPTGRLTSTYTEVSIGNEQYRTLPATVYTYVGTTSRVATVTGPKPGHPDQTVTTTYQYDTDGNVTDVFTPGADDNTTRHSHTAYVKNQDGSRTITAYPDAADTTVYSQSAYDAHGQLTATLDMPGGYKTLYTYNAAGQTTLVVSQHLANGQWVTDETTETVYAYVGGAATDTVVHDGANALVAHHRTRLDDLGQVLAELTVNPDDTEELEVAYTYDALGRQTSLSDGTTIGGHFAKSGTTYGKSGQTLGTTYPGGGTTKYTQFDTAHRLLQAETPRVNGLSWLQSFVYNDDGLLTSKTDNRGATLMQSYDTSNRLATSSNGTATYTHTYDANDTETSTTVTYDGMAQPITLTPTLNPDGSRAALTMQVGNWSRTDTNTYDAKGRLIQVTNTTSGAYTQWTYDAQSRITKQASFGGDDTPIVYTTYAYDSQGRLSALQNYKGDDTLLSAFTDIVYDAKGNRTSMHMNITTLPNTSWDRTHTYDSRDRLATDSLTHGQNTVYNKAYTFDVAGNPTNFAGDEYQYNVNNQISAVKVDGAWDTEQFVYDEDGNPTTYKGVTCTYNSHGNLTAYGDFMTAGYNDEGLRIWKQAGETKMYFIYDGETLIAEANPEGTVAAHYTWGNGGIVSREAGEGLTYYLYDPQGSVVQRINDSGTVTDTDAYDTWGNLAQGTPGEDPVGFRGKFGYYTDGEAGLILCTHRYYDNQVGRWITRDPIDYYGGVNIYEYCDDNSVMNIDCSGEDFFWEGWYRYYIGDPDIAKGRPHWDGPENKWIDRDGNLHDKGKPTKPLENVNKNWFRKWRDDYEKWKKKNDGKLPEIDPQPEKKIVPVPIPKRLPAYVPNPNPLPSPKDIWDAANPVQRGAVIVGSTVIVAVTLPESALAAAGTFIVRAGAALLAGGLVHAAAR